MNKLGIQWQRETDAVLDYNRLVQPTVLKSVNCRTREFWQQLTNDNPNSIRIYRHYPNYDEWRDEPEQCAVNAVHKIMAEIAHIQDLIAHIEDNNEWCFPFFSDAEIDAADRYMETFIKTAWNSFGMRTVFLNSACGHWGDDIIKFWRALQAAEQFSAILGQHEYDWPTLMRIYEESGEYWLCGKWQKSMAAIKAAGYKNIKCIITETGIDGGVADKPMKGWKSVPNALENYCASLLWYNDLLIADDDVLGTAIFIMSGEGMWNDFDIEGSEVPARIALFPTVPPPEPPPNGGIGMKIYDMEGNLRDKEWMHTKYGVIWKRYQAEPGQKVYRLVELREKTGNHSLITKVVDEAGMPINQMDVAFYWSGAPMPPDPPTTLLPHDWYQNFVHGPTNLNGDVGPGMGTGAYHGPGECGPHSVWVRDTNTPSDICECLGMLAGTFHDHMDQKFKRVGVVPDPENMKVVAEWNEMSELAMLYLVYPAEIAYDTRGRAGIAGSEIDLETSEPEAYEWRGKTWACVGVCTHFTEDEQRTFWLEAHDYHTGAAVTPRVSAEFGPNEKRAKFFVVDFDGEEPPPVADFMGSPTSGDAPLNVSFTDLSTNSPTAWSWTFGDEVTSSLPNPNHTYNDAGVYTVTLTASNTSGSDTITKTNYITVVPPKPKPAWTMTVARWPGIRLLIGVGLPVGTQVVVSAPWGSPVTVTAGSKAEHGPGGWEVNIWHAANYTIGFLEEVFNVDVGDETVKCTFTLEEPEPPPDPKARLVSVEMPKDDAEQLLAELTEEGYDFFSIEEM